MAWAVSALTLVVVLVALAVGIRSVGALNERTAAEQRDRTGVVAVVTEDVGMDPEAGTRVSAPVRWTEADGIERTGTAQVTGPVGAGDRVPIWVTADHRPVRGPLTPLEVVVVATVMGFAVFATGETLVFLLGRLASGWVGRLRGAEWAREWADVEPRWSRR